MRAPAPTLYVLVGLPAAAKTTRARELAREHPSLRLSTDEWMIPLFGESDAAGKRDVLEGRLIATALRVLELGTSVVLDFGFWGRDERSALRWLAQCAGASCVVVYLPVDDLVQRQRVDERYVTPPEHTFPVSADDLAGYRTLFEVPRPDELDDSALDPPPTTWANWAAWANHRWPSLDVATR